MTFTNIMTDNIVRVIIVRLLQKYFKRRMYFTLIPVGIAPNENLSTLVTSMKHVSKILSQREMLRKIDRFSSSKINCSRAFLQ